MVLNEIVCPFCGQKHEYPEDIKATNICNCGAAWLVEDADDIPFVLDGICKETPKVEVEVEVVENIDYPADPGQEIVFNERQMDAVFWKVQAP